MYTNDPIADFAAYDFDQQKALEKLPICSECREPITDEYAFYINHDWICCSCMDYYKRENEEF